tara:strand:- start:639 stop:842 length:204 start_codon:yes stop_codon:yes gene_type:complete
MSNINDDLRLALADLGFTGAIPEAIYNHLGSLGHVGTISDRLNKAGGFQKYLEGMMGLPYTLPFKLI